MITPTVKKVIEKRDKASRILALDGINAVEELHKKAQAEKEKVRRKSGTGQLQKYGTIYIGDGRLKAIARNEARERGEAEYQAKQAVLQWKKVIKSLKDSYKQAGTPFTLLGRVPLVEARLMEYLPVFEQLYEFFEDNFDSDDDDEL